MAPTIYIFQAYSEFYSPIGNLFDGLNSNQAIFKNSVASVANVSTEDITIYSVLNTNQFTRILTTINVLSEEDAVQVHALLSTNYTLIEVYQGPNVITNYVSGITQRIAAPYPPPSPKIPPPYFPPPSRVPSPPNPYPPPPSQPNLSSELSPLPSPPPVSSPSIPPHTPPPVFSPSPPPPPPPSPIPPLPLPPSVPLAVRNPSPPPFIQKYNSNPPWLLTITIIVIICIAAFIGWVGICLCIASNKNNTYKFRISPTSVKITRDRSDPIYKTTPTNLFKQSINKNFYHIDRLKNKKNLYATRDAHIAKNLRKP